MIALHEDSVVDEQGNRKAVVIPMGEWLQILEEFEDVRAYDEARRYPSDAVPAESELSWLSTELCQTERPVRRHAVRSSCFGRILQDLPLEKWFVICLGLN